jgi:hypothetical protein
MAYRILAVYFTQTGQLLDVVNSVMSPAKGNEEFSVHYEELKPEPPFPFPWTSDTFFQTMPECVKGIPCKLKPLSLTGKEDFDLIIVAWQPWFLSPSMPVHAFFQDEAGKKLISGKPVITVIGSRNMWVNGQEKIRSYISEAGGRLAGNIVLFDRASNLLSIVSIIRWMFSGKKTRYLGIFPPAGISQEDIKGASRYGQIIFDALKNDEMEKVRTRLVDAGSVEIRPELVMIEKRGIVFFRLWADYILKKGPHGSDSRLARIRLFKYYLLAVIYLASPFASLLFFIAKPFRRKAIEKQITLYQS